MRSSAEVLEGNKVKLTVEVDEADVQRAEAQTLRRLGREVAMPGFRPGHVPGRLIEARLGKKGVREEVLRDSLADYYADAVEEQNLDVIAEPEIDISSGEEEGPVVFSAVVEVRPEVLVPGYDGLVVTVPGLSVGDVEVSAQIDRMREQFASLSEVDRAARDGDIVTLDVHGTRDGEPAEGLTADDLVYQVGSGGIVEGIDEKLFGAKVGDSFEMDAEDAPDGPAHLHVSIKQIREKILPEVDDEFAKDASEFETIAELHDDLVKRMSQVKRLQTTMALRDNLGEALVALVSDEPPEALVNEQRDQNLQEIGYRLSQQRISFPQYLEAMGEDEETFLATVVARAAEEVKLDLALRAVAKAEDLEPDESETDEEIVHLAGHQNVTPAQMRDSLEKNGRMPLLRAEIRKQKAMKWLLDHVAIVDDAGAAVDRNELQQELSATEAHNHEDEDEDHDGGLEHEES